ncbi:hypothetical protein SAMN05661096_01031 [Marivirga sericea]|uniref:CarboxypepD_reg-like domain-containing protein n=1 Tax=Marivirga sericea TaxID=1028 RepID=A0A1X7ITH2_9BACT|nr:hypothetical protein [Marivirga sericea]SMG18174.1 hypothetical protein SAMN05661096_01031 [Marivirga sericea]
MNHPRTYIFFLFLGFYCFNLTAQEQLDGVILDEETRDPIEGSHVLNLSKKTMAVTNNKGEFLVQAQAFDTLLISNVNYQRKQFIILKPQSVIVLMTPLVIQLDEVEVSNIPINSNIFSEKVRELEKQKSKKLRMYGVPEAKPMAEIPPLFQVDNSLKFWENGRILPPHTIDIYVIPKMLSRKYKAKMKYYALKADKGEITEVNKKFNRVIIKQLVKLEGDLLTDFIMFMDVEDDFIKKSSEYEIAAYIKEKYNEFMHFGE